MAIDLARDSVMALNFTNRGIDVMNLAAFLRAFIGPLVPCHLLTASAGLFIVIIIEIILVMTTMMMLFRIFGIIPLEFSKVLPKNNNK